VFDYFIHSLYTVINTTRMPHLKKKGSLASAGTWANVHGTWAKVYGTWAKVYGITS